MIACGPRGVPHRTADLAKGGTPPALHGPVGREKCLFGWILFRIYGRNTAGAKYNKIDSPGSRTPRFQAGRSARSKLLAMIFLMTLALLLLIRILERIGISAIMVRILDPILRLLGISISASTLTMVRRKPHHPRKQLPAA